MAREEPDVAVLGAFAPAADVHVADARDRHDGAVDLQEQRAKLGRAVVVEVGEVDVCARHQQHDAGQAVRLAERADVPVVVRPERALGAARALAAVDAAFAVSRRLRCNRPLELARRHRPDEGPRVPLLDGRRAQRTVRALPELLRRLGHGAIVCGVEWPQRFYDRKAGIECPICAEGRPEETPHGVRFYTGGLTDVYLAKEGVQRGLSRVFFRGRHVVEPTELAHDEAARFWAEVMHAGRAIERVFEPVKMNYN